MEEQLAFLFWGRQCRSNTLKVAKLDLVLQQIHYFVVVI